MREPFKSSELQMFSSSPAAFTLIEILVVIAIIAVLAAILLPVSSGALGRARDTKSLNNLSQLSKGLQLYQADNETYPFSVNNSAGLSDFWTEAIKPYLGNQTNVFASPNEKNHNGLSDYGVNTMAICPSNVGPAGVVTGKRRPVTLPRPARTVLICDARDTLSSPIPAGSWMVDGDHWVLYGEAAPSYFGACPPRNSGGKVVFAAFGDGRVEAIARDRWASNRAQFFDPTQAP